MACIDPIEDVLRRIAEREPTVRESVLNQVALEVRADWAGQTHYFTKVTDMERFQLMERNRLICADHQRLVAGGMTAAEANDYLARRHDLTLRRIRQIVSMK